MKKYLFALLVIFLCGSVHAAPPSRVSTYRPLTTISSSEVTANEDAIFSYLQAGVDTFKDGTIVNADIAASAAIDDTKLDLSSVAQDILFSGTLEFDGVSNFDGAVDFDGAITADSTIYFTNLPTTTESAPTLNGQLTNKAYVDSKFNTSTGHDHDGSDSKKVIATNLDMTGITSGNYLYNNAGTLAGATGPGMTIVGAYPFNSGTTGSVSLSSSKRYFFYIIGNRTGSSLSVSVTFNGLSANYRYAGYETYYDSSTPSTTNLYSSSASSIPLTSGSNSGNVYGYINSESLSGTANVAIYSKEFGNNNSNRVYFREISGRVAATVTSMIMTCDSSATATLYLYELN